MLVVLKLGTGIVSGSLGLVSAGIESSGDVIAAVLTFLAIRLGGRPPDADHPYGHRRAENLGALGEAAILTGGGVFIVVEAIGQLAHGTHTLGAGWYVFAVIGVALVVDASRVVVSLRTARMYHSAALRSNAFHFAGDMAGSLAVLCGLIAVAAGFDAGDAIAALVVACIIFVAAGRLIYENARVLMDTAPTDAQARAEQAINGLGEGVDLRRLRLRESGGQYFADAVVTVPPGQAIVEGHGTADAIEAAVRDALPDTDVVVHLEPRRDGLDLRDRTLAAALAEPLVREAHDITIYEHDRQVSISLHLKLAPGVSIGEAHDVAERVEAALRDGAGRRRRADASGAARGARRRPPRRGARRARRGAAPAHQRARTRPHRPAAAGAAAAARRRWAGRLRVGRRPGRHDAPGRPRAGQPSGGRDPRRPAADAGRGRPHRALRRARQEGHVAVSRSPRGPERRARHRAGVVTGPRLRAARAPGT